jgi:hypothetical protein
MQKAGAFLQFGLNVTSCKRGQVNPTPEFIQQLNEKVLEDNRKQELCVNENSPQSVVVCPSRRDQIPTPHSYCL